MSNGEHPGKLRLVRFTIAALTAMAIAAVVFPATSLAAAGSLDHSFDGNGRLVIQAAEDTARGNIEVTRLQPIAVASAAGPHGQLVAANDRRVFRYRADGRPRRQFGGNGRAAIPTPAGQTFQLAGVAVDSRGRVLVAGTTEPIGATGGSRDARVSVYRFLPNGRLDTGFGTDGVAGAGLGPVEATGLAVDSRDRPVLTGFTALTPSTCNSTPVYLNTTVVARLTNGGAPDPTFGSGGTFTDPLEDPYLPTLRADGRGIVYVSAPEQRCAWFEDYEAGGAPVASVLSPRGSLGRRFPVRPDSQRYYLEQYLEPTSIAVDRRNRIVVLMTAYPPEGGDQILQEVRRFLPNGRPDPHWHTWFGYEWQSPMLAVTTDGRNRVILAGSALRRQGRLVSRRFAVERLNAAGGVQAWFGHDGIAMARFGRRAQATASQVHIDSRGRIVAGGTVKAPWLSTGYGLAFARFLSGRR